MANSKFVPISLAGNLDESSVRDAVMVVDVDKSELRWDLGEVVDQMDSQGIQRLILCDQGGKICGLITYENLLQVLRKRMETFLRLAERQFDRENASGISFANRICVPEVQGGRGEIG